MSKNFSFVPYISLSDAINALEEVSMGKEDLLQSAEWKLKTSGVLISHISLVRMFKK